MAQLTCQNLSIGYDSKAILHDLSFSINSGDYLCILGENGSGKSTLMKTMLGLLTPISGKILTGDGLTHNEIGYLPQQTVVQKDFPASVKEIVLSGYQSRCGLRPFYNSHEKQLAADAFDKMGISHLSKHCYRELSVGALAIGYLLMNLFSSSSNLSGDVCASLFGSTSILTLTITKVWLCAGLSVIVVLAMNLVGSLLISALVIFPALSAMRIFKSFKSVTICSATLSVLCALSGIIISILAGTPVGSTIVAVDIIVFFMSCVIGKLFGRLRIL